MCLWQETRNERSSEKSAPDPGAPVQEPMQVAQTEPIYKGELMQESLPPPLLLVGLDWGSQNHQFCILDPTGKKLEEGVLPNEANALEAWLNKLLARLAGQADRIAVAIETPRGILVETCLDRGFAVHSINPKQLDRLRDRYYPSGAKDDRRDAFILAESLRTDPNFFRLVIADDPVVLRLRELSRHDETVTTDFVRISNQFRDQLARYYPQLLGLCPSANETWLWALLQLAPTPTLGAKLTRKKITTVLTEHRIRRVSTDQVQAALRATGFALIPGSAAAHSERALLMIDSLKLLHKQHKDLGRRLENILESLSAEVPQILHQSDASIILSLPGIGTRVAATLLAEASGALQLRDYRALRIFAGAAPVTRQSGKSREVSIRRSCNARLRQALFHWSMISYRHDPRNKTHYQSLRAAGHSHGRALRGIADRNLKMLCSMLASGSTYDPALRAAPTEPEISNPSVPPRKTTKELAER